MPEPRLTGKIVHRTAGRVRLRFPALRGAEEGLTSLASKLAAIPGVSRVAATPLTGSIVLHHRGDWAEIEAAAIQSLALDWEQPLLAPGSPTIASAKLDPRTVIGGSLGLLALLQLLRREVLPPALTLLWYAATLVVDRPADN